MISPEEGRQLNAEARAESYARSARNTHYSERTPAQERAVHDDEVSELPPTLNDSVQSDA